MEYNKIVYGFHGCDESVRRKILSGEQWRPSANTYDWLGSGIYFWENDERRAYEWAKNEAERNGRIKNPAIIGAKINLGRCLDATTLEGVEMLRKGYRFLKQYTTDAGLEMPKNSNIKNDSDWKMRFLDCAVIQTVHKANENEPFETVRGAFIEGKKVYPGAGFKDLSHIQVCVVNEKNILEVF